MIYDQIRRIDRQDLYEYCTISPPMILDIFLSDVDPGSKKSAKIIGKSTKITRMSYVLK